MAVDPPVGSRPSGAEASLLRNSTIIFVSAVVNFTGLLMCYTTGPTHGNEYGKTLPFTFMLQIKI